MSVGVELAGWQDFQQELRRAKIALYKLLLDKTPEELTDSEAEIVFELAKDLANG